jgi:hypothetical protein
MFTLVANTVTQIVQKESRARLFRIASDSTTMTRIGTSDEQLQGSQGGQILTAYESILVLVPPGGELYAVSTATPNISATETADSGAGDPDRVKRLKA